MPAAETSAAAAPREAGKAERSDEGKRFRICVEGPGMNDALIIDPKAVTAVMIGGSWNDVIRETFHLIPIEIEGSNGPLWAAGFAFKTSASSEHSYSSVIVTTSGPIESIQALRST
jgi:hypothetical protein